MSNESLKQRLRKTECGDDGGFGKNVTCWHRNPDGQEAVAEIQRLERELAKSNAALEATPTDEQVEAALDIIHEGWRNWCEDSQKEVFALIRAALDAARNVRGAS